MFSKTYIVFISISPDHRDRRTIRSYLQGILRWSVKNLVNLIHGYSYLVSLEIVIGRAKKFSRMPGQFKYVTRETKYHVSITEFLI